MTEDNKPVQIEGFRTELENDRAVFVGQVPGEDEVYVRLFNEGVETKVRLSFDGAKALHDLLGRISSRGLMIEGTWLATFDRPASEVEMAT